MKRSLFAVALVAVTLASCRAPAKPAVKQYPLEGQILAVLPDQGRITIKHGDIAGFMPAMTMTYPVAPAA
ncbi:MAG: copper-binding protein, partial [Acidobacteriota bacterium]